VSMKGVIAKMATSTANTNASRTTRLIVTAIVAVMVLALSAYLFKIGQAAVGGTLAGAIVAHYFSTATSTATATQVSDTAAATAGMVLNQTTSTSAPLPS